MAAAPWYLLAAGAGLLVLGAIISNLMNRGSGRVFITAKMSDKEVERILNQNRVNPLGNIIAFVGIVLIVVSIVWRIVRIFVRVQ